MSATISVFEHERLRLGEQRVSRTGETVLFSQTHYDALVAYNQRRGNRFFTVGHRQLRFRQYVGFILVGGLGIEILPKADRRQRAGHAPYRDALLDMLRSVRQLRLERSSEASLRTRESTLLEVYIAEFLAELRTLQREGLVRGYRREHGNQRVFRGRLLVREHIRHNLVRADRVFSAHQVYDHDTPVNKALLAALQLLERMPLRHRLRTQVERARAAMPERLRPLRDPNALAKLSTTRQSARYARALTLAQLLLAEQAPMLQRGAAPVFAILFDMNMLWERYVLALLRQVAPTQLEISGQSSRAFWRAQGSSRARLVRPDILIRDPHSQEVLAVLDTKWKLVEGQPSIGDLGQMFIYNERFGAPRSSLIYPGSDATTRARAGHFVDKEHSCGLAFLSLMDTRGFRPVYARQQAKLLLAALGLPGAEMSETG